MHCYKTVCECGRTPRVHIDVYLCISRFIQRMEVKTSLQLVTSQNQQYCFPREKHSNKHLTVEIQIARGLPFDNWPIFLKTNRGWD